MIQHCLDSQLLCAVTCHMNLPHAQTLTAQSSWLPKSVSENQLKAFCFLFPKPRKEVVLKELSLGSEVFWGRATIAAAPQTPLLLISLPHGSQVPTTLRGARHPNP